MRKTALAGALATFLCGCSRAPENVSAKKSEQPPAVAVAKATREDLARDLKISAEFVPWQEIEVHAKVAGYVRRILVDVGDRVGQGQLIAELEIPEQADDVAQAQANKKRAEADVSRARSELERAESAAAIARLQFSRIEQVSKARPNLIARQEIDDALARDRIAGAQASTARAALASAEQQAAAAAAGERRTRTFADYSRITAPFAGVVTKRYANTGAMIQAGTASQTQAMPVIRLSQVDRLRLSLEVPEAVVPRIRTGATVNVFVDSLSREFTGRVSRFSGRIATATRTMETEVDVANPRFELMPGMYATATLALASSDEALSIPIEAIQTQAGRSTAYVVGAGNKVEERVLKLGVETPNRVQVLSGLNDGDLVVVSARSLTRPGAVVTPKLAGGD